MLEVMVPPVQEKPFLPGGCVARISVTMSHDVVEKVNTSRKAGLLSGVCLQHNITVGEPDWVSSGGSGVCITVGTARFAGHIKWGGHFF